MATQQYGVHNAPQEHDSCGIGAVVNISGRQTHEPVYITRNGSGDMVVLSMEEYERQRALIDLYGKLAVAEQEITSGAEGEDFLTAARQLRERVHGKL